MAYSLVVGYRHHSTTCRMRRHLPGSSSAHQRKVKQTTSELPMDLLLLYRGAGGVVVFVR